MCNIPVAIVMVIEYTDYRTEHQENMFTAFNRHKILLTPAVVTVRITAHSYSVINSKSLTRVFMYVDKSHFPVGIVLLPATMARGRSIELVHFRSPTVKYVVICC